MTMVKTRRRPPTARDTEQRIKAWAGVLADALAHPGVDRNGRLVFKTKLNPLLRGHILIPIPMKEQHVESARLCRLESEILTLRDASRVARHIAVCLR